MHVLGQERRGRGGRQVDQRGELVGRTGHRVPPAGQQLGRVLSGVEDDTAQDGGSDRMQRELQLGDHAEVPATAPQCPEQVSVLVFAGPHQLTFGGHHFGGQQVVASQSVLADKVPDAAAQREPADPGRGNQAARGGQAVRLGLVVELPPGRAALRECPPAARVHAHRRHRRKIEHDTAVAGGEPGNAVRAAADRHRQPFTAGELDPADHVGDSRTAQNKRGMLVDRPVPDLPGVLVAGVSRGDHRAEHACPEFGQRRLTEDARAFRCHRLHVRYLPG